MQPVALSQSIQVACDPLGPVQVLRRGAHQEAWTFVAAVHVRRPHLPGRGTEPAFGGPFHPPPARPSSRSVRLRMGTIRPPNDSCGHRMSIVARHSRSPTVPADTVRSGSGWSCRRGPRCRPVGPTAATLRRDGRWPGCCPGQSAIALWSWRESNPRPLSGHRSRYDRSRARGVRLPPRRVGWLGTEVLRPSAGSFSDVSVSFTPSAVFPAVTPRFCCRAAVSWPRVPLPVAVSPYVT